MKTWRNSRGMPPRIERLANMVLQDTAALTCVQTWLDGSLPVLVLYGGTGCGKTLAAAHAVTTWPRSARWISAVELATLAPWDADIPTLIDCGLLVIDDVGVEEPGDRMRRVMDRIVDGKINADTRMIITTNIQGDEIKDRYGARLRSRLTEHGYVFGCGGRDLRDTDIRPQPLEQTREPDSLAAPRYVSPERVDEIVKLVHVGER